MVNFHAKEFQKKSFIPLPSGESSRFQHLSLKNRKWVENLTLLNYLILNA